MNDLEILEELNNREYQLENISLENFYEIYETLGLEDFRPNFCVLVEDQIVALGLDSINFSLDDIDLITNLSELFYLDLGGNNLSSLPDSFANLTKLQELSLARNKFQSVPNCIFKLVNLQKLYFYTNQISEVPEVLGSLTQLTNLTLNKNQITSLPPSLANLRKLESLCLDDNYISYLPDELSKLTNLETLILHNNPINKIPDGFVDLKKLSFFNIDSTPLAKMLDESSSLSPKNIITYLLKIQNSAKKPLNEAKLLVIGDERVGKTSTINRITDQPFDTNQKTTEGIDILHHQLSNGIKLNIWDFAGQEITHQTHQFFLSTRSLYLLVIDAQKEDNDSGIYHWLNVIKTNGADSPIIVVVNKIDHNESFRFDINRYQQEFNIAHVCYISAEKQDNIEELISKIEEQVETLDGVKNVLPEEWFQIKEELENFAVGNVDFIERNSFEKLCEKYNVCDENQQSTLLNILNQIGTIVTYENNHRLNVMQIINPLWVTNGVYKIIRSEVLERTKGILRLDDFEQIFQGDLRYKKRHYRWLADLLNQFEVSFGISESEILIPTKLESNQPSYEISKYQTGLNFQYTYETFLKKSIISHFIVKMNRYIDVEMEIKYWQRGVFLKYYNSKAVIISDEDKKIISIAIDTNEKQGRDLLAIIRHAFSEINAKKYRVHEKIPLLIENKIVGFEDYNYLINCEQEGDENIRLKINIEPHSHKFNIKDLLDGYRLTESSGFDYKKLTDDLIDVALIETENRKAIFKESEDDTNDRFKNALLHKGYHVSDQSRGGESGSGKRSGERDIVVRNRKSGTTESVIEAFQLTSLDTTVINSHYEKLIKKYDTVGNNRNYVLVYSKAKDYKGLWAKYQKHFKLTEAGNKYSSKDNVSAGISQIGTGEVFHIFINFYPTV